MVKNVDISVYQPPIVKDYKEFKEISRVENEMLTDCWSWSNKVFLDQFIETLTDNGCKRWEKILNIQPKGTDTLEVRRFRIKSRINEDLPYTYKALLNVLDNLCGNGYEVTLFNDEYRLKILIELTVKRMFDEVEKTVRRMLPANMILEVSLRYNQHISFRYKHSTLGKYTHRCLREEVLL
ncbi:MAG: DUF2313 domain-containing protein [Tyzzerella sp.]|uniref:DUF2313 domain-containing protein n=1 Tax=Candidatus Fimicola merdigallinarum TaxID=2840819 RepID=A0A9D9DX91_9FIRM|nr:DUF2313 domain-containing protein [Candidatus Fimicola merdigallinarum]